MFLNWFERQLESYTNLKGLLLGCKKAAFTC